MATGGASGSDHPRVTQHRPEPGGRAPGDQQRQTTTQRGQQQESAGGISVTPFGVDLPRLLDAKRDLVNSLRAEKYTDLAAEYGWDILDGTAAFATDETSEPVLRVDLAAGRSQTIVAEHYLIATGSTPWAPPTAGLAEAGYLTSTTAMELDTLPTSVIVIRGNAIGLEQAQLWNRLRGQVIVVEALARLAPFEEPEVSTVIAEVFTRDGIRVVTSATITCTDRDHTGYRVALTGADGKPAVLRPSRCWWPPAAARSPRA